jgi:arylsulfatase A-like enzyme
VSPSSAGWPGLALALACCGAPVRPGTPPVHAVLITISDLRADRVGAYGHPRPTTASAGASTDPLDVSIDGLAASGVAFASAFAPSADERVSLAELLTGARAAPADRPSLADAFQAAGFRTAAFVTGAAAAEPALMRGFAAVARGAGEDPDRDAVRAAVAWLRDVAAPADEPFFLWVHLSGPAEPAEAPHLADLYDAEVARMARLVEQLSASLAGRFGTLPRELLSSSVVVVAGTRGAEFSQPAHAAEDRAALLDSALRVPLILRHPASLTGRRFLAELVELRDVAPTLFAWFDLAPAPGAGEGRSLLALTDRRPAAPFASRPIVLHRPDGGSVRTPTRHLIVTGHAVHLYDPARDPLERVDRAAAEPDTVRELSALLAVTR